MAGGQETWVLVLDLMQLAKAPKSLPSFFICENKIEIGALSTS